MPGFPLARGVFPALGQVLALWLCEPQFQHCPKGNESLGAEEGERLLEDSLTLEAARFRGAFFLLGVGVEFLAEAISLALFFPPSSSQRFPFVAEHRGKLAGVVHKRLYAVPTPISVGAHL